MRKILLKALADVVDMKTGKKIGDRTDRTKDRYPRAVNELTDDDVDRLDVLFHDLNRMSRDDSKFDKIAKEIALKSSFISSGME